ncbi:MAG: hypothetical protein AAFV95_13595 [Bacteroidota bacterium]
MENNHFDKYLREKLENLDPGFQPEHWDLFEQSLDKLPDPTGEGRSNLSFDDLARQKLGNLEVEPGMGHWEEMERLIEASEESPIDEIAYNHLHNLQAPYKPEHWNLMLQRLNQEAFLRQIVYRYKLAEVALFLLVLLTFVQYLPVSVAPNLADDQQAPAQYLMSPTDQSADLALQSDVATASVISSAATGESATDEVAAPIASSVVDAPKSAGSDSTVPPAKTAATEKADASNTSSFVSPSLSSNAPVRSLVSSVPGITARSMRAVSNAAWPSIGLGNGPLEMSLLLPIEKLQSLLLPGDGPFAELPDCENCQKGNQRGRLSIGMFAASDINYVMTPYNSKLRVPSYDQFFAGYGGGISLTYQIRRWSVEIAGIYSAIFYQPERLLIEVNSGNLQSGYYGRGFRSARMDVLKIPLNLRFRFSNLRKWNIYALAGGTLNTAVFKQYEIVKAGHSNDLRNFPKAVPVPGNGNGTGQLEDNGYKGFFENGRLKDNIYFTANLGVGVERYFNQRWSIFVQPVYQHQFLSTGDGFGPNNDRLNSFSTYIGVRRSLLK